MLIRHRRLQGSGIPVETGSPSCRAPDMQNFRHAELPACTPFKWRSFIWFGESACSHIGLEGKVGRHVENPSYTLLGRSSPWLAKSYQTSLVCAISINVFIRLVEMEQLVASTEQNDDPRICISAVTPGSGADEADWSRSLPAALQHLEPRRWKSGQSPEMRAASSVHGLE
jgi:hypothetical protein